MLTELIDVMGSDDRIVDAARVSFDKGASNYTAEQNQKLLSYLARHNHFTPFTHVQITMRETVPIFVARQRFKSSVGFTYNEVSRRYVDDEPEFYVPEVWRQRAENKKQGSSDEVVKLLYVEGLIPEPPANAYERFIIEANELYHDMIKNGVAPEQARMILPQSMYTSYYCTGSLAAWARAYNLRSEEYAQKEIQDLAAQWNSIISGIDELKYSWSALTTIS